jgi:hypothetical protein
LLAEIAALFAEFTALSAALFATFSELAAFLAD